jgi:hypothetical protein
MGTEWILWRLAGDVEWIQLAQDRDRWQAVVNTVMNLRVLAPRSQSVEESVRGLILRHCQKIRLEERKSA